MLPWPKVQRRIAQLIKEDRFYTEAEQDRFDNIDPVSYTHLDVYKRQVLLILVLADVADGLFQPGDFHLVLFRIIPEGGVDGLLRQQGAVDLHRRQPVQGCLLYTSTPIWIFS